MTASDETLARLASRFRRFAETEADGSSPLYARLSRGVADDHVLLDLVAGSAQTSQPAPNLLFGAVHRLLLRGAQHALRHYYPSLVGGADLDESDPVGAFHDFCLTHRTEVQALLATRLVQTNEVGRAASLLPAFQVVSDRVGGRPLALVEIGCSAGLLLAWDRFRYDYAGFEVGDVSSPLTLAPRLEGDRLPPAGDPLPPVGSRLGIDLNPLDVTQADDRDWLRALVWPEHAERAARLDAAIALFAADPAPRWRGDAVELLPRALEDAPPDATICVFHCHTLNQFPREASDRLRTILRESGRTRTVYRVAEEWTVDAGTTLDLFTYGAGEERHERLAQVDHHGRWIRWLAE